jgi:signal transduction histidine kinase
MSARIPLSEYSDTERMPIEVVRKQSAELSSSPVAMGLANASINAIVILNPQRQIVFASQSAVAMTPAKQADTILGLRLGEALGCVHSGTDERDCGVTEFCAHCGGLKAILTGLSGQPDKQEYRVTRIINLNTEDLDLLVCATPFTHNNQRYTILSISDHSHEKRRQGLERVFFHDLASLAGGLEAYLKAMASSVPTEVQSKMGLVHEGLQQLIEEITSQKALAAAENNELQVVLGEVDSEQLLRSLQRQYLNHPAGRDRVVEIKPGSAKVRLVSDKALLKRVLGSLLRNALEAVEPGQSVILACQHLGDRVQFEVHNRTCMSNAVRLQVFKRSFSTKGMGRGLGTYSAKLITERYLKGTMDFSSTKETGTRFTVTLPLAVSDSAGSSPA